VKDPEKYLSTMGLDVRCVVHPERKASYDASCREYVNHDVYLLADEAARKEFDADPLRYCGDLTDPVTKKRFHPTRSSPRRRYHKRLYVFSTPVTAAKFRADPKQYAVRNDPPMATPVPSAAATRVATPERSGN
jgi:YHS domain-containing protein